MTRLFFCAAPLFALALLAPGTTDAREAVAWPTLYEETGYWAAAKAAVPNLPPNSEIFEFWIVCKRGYIANPHTGRGCVEPLPRGVNPTVIHEIPGSAGTWGSKKGAPPAVGGAQGGVAGGGSGGAARR